MEPFCKNIIVGSLTEERKRRKSRRAQPIILQCIINVCPVSQ